MFFAEKSGRSTSVKLSDVSKKITGKGWKKYKKPLEAELEKAGFLSEARQRVQKILFGVGIVLLMLGVIGIVATAIWGGSLGYAPLAVSIAVVVLGIAGMISGAVLVPLSDAGAKTAVAWKQFDNSGRFASGDLCL